jgi:glycerol transport system ATP-binding protein
VNRGGLRVAGFDLVTDGSRRFTNVSGPLTLGIRPEYVTLAEPNTPGALPVRVTQAQDIGMYWLVTGMAGAGADERAVRARIAPQQAIPKPGSTAWFGVVGAHTCFYSGDELIEEAGR